MCRNYYIISTNSRDITIITSGLITMDFPASTKHLYNICTMLDQRRRRWSNIVQILYRCFCVCWANIQGHLRMFSVVWCHIGKNRSHKIHYSNFKNPPTFLDCIFRVATPVVLGSSPACSDKTFWMCTPVGLLFTVCLIDSLSQDTIPLESFIPWPMCTHFVKSCVGLLTPLK